MTLKYLNFAFKFPQFGKRFLLLPVLWFSCSAHAYFQLELMKSKRSSDRQASQWTIGDWLAQKNRVNLMDHWLAMNTKSGGIEINTNAGAQQFQLTTDSGSGEVKKTHNGQVYSLDMYILLLNLHGEYEKTDNGWESYGGAAGLRLLGDSSQTSSLVARYGWRKKHDLNSMEIWENQYVEGVLQLYLVQFFGLQGQYRYYFPNESNKGRRYQGHKTTAGVFLEMGLFRLYANAYQEPMEIASTDQTTVTKESRQGLEGGLKLYF